MLQTTPCLGRGVGGGSLFPPCLSFKPFHVAISEGSHVAIRISSISENVDCESQKTVNTLS